MKQIVPSPTYHNILPIKELYIDTNSDYSVVAYQTSGGMWAVLIYSQDYNQWGFIYLKDMMRGRVKDLKFMYNTYKGAVNAALMAGRDVFYFDNTTEFFRHIIK